MAIHTNDDGEEEEEEEWSRELLSSHNVDKSLKKIHIEQKKSDKKNSDCSIQFT